ncbi:hypothetical protein [Phenylobacterium sp.]|uniref:hypothetical protein n=1 Tax=Phenylobacterium sp. TaxID=1871053 RepID=UPI002734567F|nr:hypothetical protein [Phenylobacterium sp.]MDP3854123.1 hypothetical protein [Phenylobacterium sp.]
MKKLIATIVACALLSACTTTNTRLAVNPVKPAAGARIILIDPDIELSVLTAAGMQEPKADWTEQGRANIAGHIEAQMKARAHNYRLLDPNDAMAGRTGQLLRLHQAVGQSIMMFNYGYVALPTKKASFDWTLGEGAQALGTAYQADYALFVFGRGSYASGGRVAVAVGMAMLGAAVPMGSQQCFASLVDLKTGQVVWFNVAVAGPNADMRKPEGAAALVAAVLKDAPL